jgi:digeranylgeranylglycerophospholipid reductase
MEGYDVIVVGAGPAGTAAAKAAAERGAKTLLLEEHKIVGVPSHCTGLLGSGERPDIVEDILASIDDRVIIRYPNESPNLHIFAPDGKLIKADPWPSYLYLEDRAVFDQEIVKQAISAGVELKLSARVTGLIKKNERITGVTTSASDLPEISGKVVIAADGIAGGVRGIARWEGLTRARQTYVGGITMEMAGIKNCDQIGGLYTGSFLIKGWINIHPSGPESCLLQFMTMEEYKRVKDGKYYLSRVLQDALPIRMDGWRHTSNLGVRFPEIVKDGLILTGSAANWRGTIISMVSGRYAGEVAAEAAKKGDTSAARLGEFISLYEKTGLTKELYQHSDWLASRPLGQCSDEEILKRLSEMLKNGLTFIPSEPVLGVHGGVN